VVAIRVLYPSITPAQASDIVFPRPSDETAQVTA
jgi:hypothetical protein